MTSALPVDHEIEDIYALSPLQRGMLFHSLAAPRTGVYINQLTLPLHGPLDRSALRRAFQQLLDRHSILRTAFEWEGIEEPVQVVHRNVELPWFEYDFRGIPEAERSERLIELFQTDRRRGFDLSRVPAMRLHLVQLGEEEHVLCWTHHHILLDGWSTPILTEELVRLYVGFISGKPAILAPARPFGEYIAWLEEQDPEAGRDHFRNLLAGFTGAMRLPMDLSGAGSSAEAPEEVASEERKSFLERELSSRVLELAQKAGATPSVVVEAAWALLLHRYAGTDDIVFGVTLSGRPPELAAVESRVGLFINTLPLRVGITRHTTGRELIDVLARQHSELFRFQHTSLSEILSLSSVPRGQRLFETVVAYQSFPAAEEVKTGGAGGGLSVGQTRGVEHGNYAATLVVTPGERVELVLSHVPSRFDARSMDLALEHLSVILEWLTRNPDAPIVELDLVTASERDTLAAWARGALRAFPDRNVVEAFLERASTRASTPALVQAEIQITYAELERRSRTLAARLRELGVGPEARVALCLERGIDLVVAILGILRAGGVYVPLDAAYPSERLKFLFEDSRASLLVTTTSALERLPPFPARPILLEEIDLEVEAAAPPLALDHDNAAYVIYTSGSTGQPKGVVVTHRGLLNTALAQIEAFRLGPESRVLAFASPSFDASVSEMFTTLLAGASLYFRAKNQLLPSLELAEWLDKTGITTVTFPPSALAVLPRRALGRLATLVVAGEACPPELVRRWSKNRDFLNAYGPTETTICVSVGEVKPGALRPPIGRPIANVTAYVLDDGMRPVPIGLIGELYAGGPGLARGYLGRPELTAERFVPNPFASGERLYRTGDRVRWNPDGELEFFERRDSQVKLRGHRIELGEIETKLERDPRVSQAVVALRDHAAGPRLCAYVVATAPVPDLAQSLKSALGRELPEYMVPAAIGIVNELPVGPTGKIDRRALPELEEAETATEYAAPQTEAERVLSEICAEVLHVSRVSRTDDFFQLGGDSLLSIQVVSRAKERGFGISIEDVFEHPRIADLAAIARATVASDAEQGQVQGELQLLPIQRWFFERQGAEPHHYNMALLFQTSRTLELDVAEQALAALVEHHDALRLRFVDGKAEHVPTADGERLVEAHDFSALSDAELGPAIEATAERVEQSLDVTHGPLLRLVLFQAGSQRPNRWLWVVHHLVVDAVSFRVLLEDFERAKDQIEHGEPVELPPKTLSLKAFSERLWHHVESDAVRNELGFWLDQLSRPVGMLPIDHETGRNSVASIGRVEASLDAKVTAKLAKGFVKSHGAHANEVLLTAIARAVATLTATPTVSILLEGHGRDALPDADVSRTVGWFTSIHPVVLRLGDSDDPLEDLGLCVSQLRAIPRRGLSFLPLREQQNASGEALRALPLPMLSFNHLGQAGNVLEAAGPVSIASESAGNECNPKAERPALIELNSLILNGRLRVTLAYSHSFHEAASAERILGAIVGELERLAEHASSALDTPLFDPNEALEEPSDRLRKAPRDQPLPLSFSQERAWFLEQLDPGRTAYQSTFMARLGGELDPALLDQALQAIVERHEGLRTTFPSVDGQAVQVVASESSLRLRFEDLTEVVPDERPSAITRLRDELAKTPFDLANGPVSRVVLVRIAEGDHMLVVTFHLILADRWSMDLFVRELGVAYDALRRGVRLPFRPLRIHYPDYAHWQRRRLSGQRLDDLVAHWQSELAGIQPLELPQDRPRPANPLGSGARKTIQLDRELTRALKALGGSLGLTPFMTLLAGFELLLHRLTGQDCFAVGTTIANRPRPELESVFGYFANLLPFRADLSGAPTFRELLRRVRASSLAAYAHQEMPFERIVEAVSPERDPSRNPIFQVMIVLHRQASGDLALSSLKMELPEAGEQTTAQFDLRVDLIEHEDGLFGTFEYSTELFDEATILDWIRAYETLLRGAIADPDCPIRSLPLLTDAERHRLLEEWNATDLDLPSDQCLHEPFFESAARSPAALAVVAPGVRLTYAELAARVTRLAQELRRRGVDKNRLIAVVLDKGLEQVVATLSILAAGGAYLPIAPSLPQERIHFLMQHASAFGAIAQPAHVAIAKFEGSAFTLALDEHSLDASAPRIDKPPRVQEPSDLAYVIYTSGSTGVPKGVALDNRGPVNTCLDINQRYRLGREDRVLMLSSLNFDLSVWDIFGTLAAGATVVIPEADRERDPAHWLELLVDSGVSVWSSVPALFEMLVEHVENLPSPPPTKLRLVMMSGDWIPVGLPARARKVFPGVELHSLGGATEASVWSIAYPIGDVDPTWRSIPYGKPLSNQRFYVLDGELEPCPVGVAGELYIGGIGIALGYHNDPVRTAESFITHPRSRERLYRTGDFGRWLRDGNIEFLGRRDGQVKIRGYRIELGEIEAALRRHDAVREAVVMARGNPRAERRLVGYVILEEATAATSEDLLRHLSDILPRYMLPSALVVLDAFPLTPNGKVDRNALPEPEADAEKSYVAPKGALEELIATTWSQLLGVPRIGSDVNFFELGGHSILATQAIARLRRVLGSQLPLRWAFECPTIAGLATRIEKELSTLGSEATPSLVKVGRDRGRPLSFSQERAWFLSEMLPNDRVHRVEIAARFPGEFRTDILESALHDLVRRHPALGTRFTSEAGRVVQSLHTADPPRLVIDERIWAEPLSARDATLFRAGLFQKDDGCVLALVAHRIIVDRASLEIALRDLVELYRVRVTGETRETPASGIRFVDFAEWEREHAKSASTLAKLTAIRARLDGVPVLDLPVDRPRPVIQSFRGDSVPIALPRALGDELRLFAEREGAPLLAVLLAGAQVVLEKHTGQTDFALGAPSSGRHAPEVSGLVGPLENHFAIRALLRDDPTLRMLVQRTRDQLVLAHLERDVPFERVVDELQPERDTARHAIFQAEVSLIEDSESELEILPAPNTIAHRDVAFQLTETATGLEGRLVFKADLFERQAMQEVAAHFQRVLERFVDAPELRVGDVPYLDERETLHVTRTLACSIENDEIQGSVHERTFELARHRPGALALRQGKQSYSYEELARRARRVAARLAAAGVGPEVVVGVLFERTLDLPVALFGVLAAGGAYLPLEPGYPRERLEYILGDSGARFVLTSSELAHRVRAAGCTPIEIEVEADERELSRSPVSPDQLAYLIYTSGSTGRPKGVGVSHGCLVNFMTTMQREPGITPDDRLLSVTSPSFDIFALELFLPLWVGASVIVAARDVVSDGERLLGELASATMMQATPATYRMLLAAGWSIPEPGARKPRLLCGGEALPAALAREVARRAEVLWNVYGPTETTVWSARQRVDHESVENDRPPPIGVPIGGTELYVLDPRMRPTSLGVWGELYIGGSGVARGYHSRPELTAERFVPDPHARVPGRRLYRTGDRCRWRRDGVLEFQSRIDHQIKLRGHRIELGEIEAVLAEHPALKDVAVTLDGQNDDARLVGYVVPKVASERSGDAEIVARWREVWDGTYAGPVDRAAPIDTTGYASSYDAKDVPLGDMQEWLDHTILHALEPGRPKRVFEIGCGTGMVLGRLAEGADFYLGSDASKIALARAERAIPRGANVRLLQQEARDFSGIEARSFDCVVLNSVIQYFPDTRYLLDVLAQAVNTVGDGGSVFVGDVRSHALLEAFALSVELAKARAQMPVNELSTLLRSRVRFEEEQVLDPGFFLRETANLERVASISFRRKLTRSQNELTLFRYDVILHVAKRAAVAASRTLDWLGDGLSESALRDVLAGSDASVLVRGVPDPSIVYFLNGLASLASPDAPRNAEQLRARLGERPTTGLYRLRELADSLGFGVRMSPVRSHGLVDLAFARHGTPLPSFEIEMPAGRVENDPLEATRQRALIPALREHAKTKLPDYMLPQSYVLLDALPLTVSGKIDRRALPAPERTSAMGAFVAPQNEIEERIAHIFADALRLDRVSANADFFALGGHSLLGTHVIAQLRNAFDVELPLRSIFAAPTVAGMAREVEEAKKSGRRAEAPRVAPAPAELVLPLSYAQERMWFIDRLYAGRGIFNIPQNFRVVGDFDFGALRRAFDELTQRHEALRTVVRLVDGIPAQIILPNVEVVEAEILDFSGLEPGEREARIHALGHEHAGRSFDLERGPLLHGQVIRVAPDEHVVLITMHHIVADGWSLGVLYTELTALYAAFREGRPSPLAPLELQYADYAVWQRNWMQGDVLEKHVAWWKERLAGFEPLELPTDRPRPAVRDYEGATVDVSVPDRMVANLRQLCLDEGATLFMGLTAAFLTLVHRQSGQDDITIGTALANRTRAELAGLIGFFINTPAVRADLGKNPTFRQLLRQVKDITLDIYQWQEAPFEKIVEALHPERDPSRYPIYNVIFGLQNLPGGEMTRAGDVKLRQLGAHTGYARYDLTIQVVDNPGALDISWEYAVALFDESTVQSLAERFGSLIEVLGENPDAHVDDVPCLTDAERSLLRTFGEPARIEPDDPRTIERQVFGQADLTPDALAMHALDGTTTTYRQLKERALAFAARLLDAGVSPEDRVAIALGKSPDFVAAALGTLAAGACFVPLDPSYPKDRLEFLMQDSGAVVLVTTRALVTELPEISARVVFAEETPRSGDPSLPRGVNERAAYIIYTSGSTGKPKGVVVPHRAVVQVIREVSRCIGPPARKNLMWFMSPSFDATILELLMTLLSGAAIHILPHEQLLPGPDLVKALEERHIDTFIVIASALEQLPLAELPELHTIVVGGEASTAESLQRWAKGRKLFVAYGPTETTIIASMQQSDGSHAHHTLGRPLPGMTAYCLDRQMVPTPPGVFGELHLGGPCVARGYHNRPELTAERFVPNPFAPNEPGARLYKSGDRARFRADGTLEFAGRVDQQIKLRGHRIELGEIEAALAASSGVRHAVVLLREDQPGDKRLVAYVVPEVIDGFEPERLKRELERLLPAYMVPSQFVLLDELPRAPTGKVDRKALAAPEPEPERALARPRTPVEELVAAAFATVLRLPAVGVDQSFFDIGGHSLLATRLVTRIREALGVELPLRTVFEDLTVERISKRVETLQLASARELPPLVPVDRAQPLPLSFAQERLWFVEQLNPGEPTYNTPIVLRLPRALSPSALERAVLELMRRHEVLRTSFPAVDGTPIQYIDPEPRFQLRRLDADANDSARIRELLEADVRRPFDLGSGPLLRGLVLSLGAEDTILCLTFHHIVIDGWSVGILMRELFELYEATVAGRRPALPPLPVQYADYAVWQRNWLTGTELERQIEFWRERLADLPRLELPLDRPRPNLDLHRGALVPFRLGKELTRALRQQAQQAGVTTFMYFLAAFGALLGRHSGQKTIAIGYPVAGRQKAELEGLIGFFVNMLVARVELQARPSFRDLLARVHSDTLGAYAHQDVPFEKLVEVIAPDRASNHSPFFSAALILEREMAQSTETEADTRPPAVELGTTKVEISLTLSEQSDAYEGVVEYDVALFDRERIERMAARFQRFLECVVTDPNQAIDEISLDSESERNEQIRQAFGCAAAAAGEGLHVLIRKRAAEWPDSPAIVDRGRSWTYRALLERVEKLAAGLRRAGVGNEKRVALALERSADLVAAMLAVLEVGAAYVPIDTKLPRERREYLLTDSGSDMLLLDAEAARLDWPSRPRCHSVDELSELGATSEPAALSPHPDRAAYVIYTSGSTGMPKGVVVSQRGLENTIREVAVALGLEPEQRVVPVCSPSFDVFGWEVFTALASGATLCIGTSEQLEPGEPLFAFLRATRANVLSIVPSSLALLEDAELPDLHTIALGGEVAQNDVIGRWSKRARLLNAYGPTETSICASMGPLDVSAPFRIGSPLANVSTHVLDERLRPCPEGVWGELCVGGAGVSRGYHARPELTAERFVPDPFTPEPGARMYRTGDRVRRQDGGLEFGGRIDGQVKLRGLRIELGEIEAALLALPGVERAAAIVREDTPGDQRLVAYVSPASAPPAQLLRTRLAEKLPSYMVPAHFLALERLPLTPSGKLDRRKLPRPTTEGAPPAHAPSTALERSIAELYAELLGSGPVDIERGFFELGGHSLLAARLKARVLTLTGRSLPLSRMFQTRLSVRELCALLESDEPSGSSPLVVGLKPEGSDEPVYVIHRAETHLLGYGELAARLGDHPVYGVLPPDSAPRSIQEVAELHAQTLLASAPHGRVHLIGHSMGGFLALEIARRLLSAGQSVGLIALVDTIWPSAELDAITRAELGARTTTGGELERHAEIVKALIHATLDYAGEAVTLDHPLLLLEAEHPPEETPVREASRARWHAVTGDLSIESIPGDHETSLHAPHVEHVAKVIRRHLAACRRR